MNYLESTFHKIHCGNCGEISSVKNFAFDVGGILKEGCIDTDFEALSHLEFKLYLTVEEFKDFFSFNQDILSFQVRHLKFLLLRLCGEENSNFDLLYTQINNVDELNKLIYRINNGSTGYKPRAYLSDLLYLCKEYDDSYEILNFKIGTNYIKDDQGLKYCNKVIFYFGNDSKEIIPICKKCGKPYFKLSGLHREYIIAMAGTARTGKTAYLAALVTVLEKNRETNHILEMKASDDIYWENFKNQVLNNYKSGKTYESNRINEQNKIPLFMLEITIKQGKYNFIFIDIPGEVYNQEVTSSQVGKFIINNKKIVNHIDAILYCIASNQISKNYLIKDYKQYEGDEAKEDIMEVISRTINTLKSIPDYKNKIVALLITKGDLLTDEYDDLLYFNSEYIEEYVDNIDLIDFNKLNQYMKRSIEYLNESKSAFYAITNEFSNLNAFAVAVYQKGIIGNNLEIAQSKVLAPFVWLLAVLRLMDVREKKCFLRKNIKIKDINSLYFKSKKEGM